MLFTRKTTIVLVIILLSSAGLACRISAAGQTGSQRPEPIPVTTEAAVQLEDSIEAAAKASAGGQPFVLQLTEAQLTSTANLELASMQEDRIKNVQIYLRDGQVDMYADLVQSGLTIPSNIKIAVYVYGEGQIGYNILSANMGPFPIPDSIIGQITDQLDQFLLTELNPASTGLIVDDIQIANGVITISAHNR